ncbi:MAG: hypothetical protein KJ062_03100 [Thermoanaerobaculia bacterium]|nr:hypothetical protein [Thermoanaerobaculia bacterium]
MNGGGGLCITLYPQRPVGGPIDFDAELGGTKVSGQIHRENPEFAAAAAAIDGHAPQWTMAGPTPPTLETTVERVKELVKRRGT